MFRISWKQDLPTRLIDLGCHIVLALVLPGPWWSQWLPDTLLPVLTIHGLYTDRFLSKYSPLLWFHKLLHSVFFPLVLIVMGIWWRPLCWIAVQWMGHLLIDKFTHDRWWEMERAGEAVVDGETTNE